MQCKCSQCNVLSYAGLCISWKVQQTNRVDQTHRERGSEWQKAVAGFAAGAFMLPGLWRHPPVTSRPSIGRITQQIQSRSRTRRSQSVVTQLEFPKRNYGNCFNSSFVISLVLIDYYSELWIIILQFKITVLYCNIFYNNNNKDSKCF